MFVGMIAVVGSSVVAFLITVTATVGAAVVMVLVGVQEGVAGCLGWLLGG